jgi:cysteinyl-tRNA synthetase
VPLADGAHAPNAPLSPTGRALHDRFVAAIDDDLDLPTALTVAREALKADLPDDERRWLALDADAVLGLGLDRVWSTGGTTRDVPERIRGLVRDRTAARDARDFARADALRSEIEQEGWDIVDGRAGPTLQAR